MDTLKIVSKYQECLNNIFNSKQIYVNSIHDHSDLCFTSSVRELIETIKGLNSHLPWCCSEKYFTIGLSIPFTEIENIELNLDPESYKSLYKQNFNNRIMLITKKYDNVELNSEQRKQYNMIKEEYNNIISQDSFDYIVYKIIRQKFDDFRYEYKLNLSK